MKSEATTDRYNPRLVERVWLQIFSILKKMSIRLHRMRSDV